MIASALQLLQQIARGTNRVRELLQHISHGTLMINRCGSGSMHNCPAGSSDMNWPSNSLRDSGKSELLTSVCAVATT